MASELEQVGLEAVFKTDRFEQGAAKYNSTVKRVNTATTAAAGSAENYEHMLANLGETAARVGGGFSGLLRHLLEAGAPLEKLAAQFHQPVEHIKALAEQAGWAASEADKFAAAYSRAGKTTADFAKDAQELYGRGKPIEEIARIMGEQPQVVRAYVSSMDKAAEATEAVGEAAVHAAPGIEGIVREAMTAGVPIEGIASSLGKTTKEIEAIAKAAGIAIPEIKKTGEAIRETGRETRRSTSYLQRYMTRMLLWITVGRLVYSVANKITQGLRDAFEAAYENTEEYKRLQAATQGFYAAAVTAVTGGKDFADVLDWIAERAEHASLVLIQDSAVIEAWAKNAGMIKGAQRELELIQEYMAQGIPFAQAHALAVAQQRYEQALGFEKDYREALERDLAAWEETKQAMAEAGDQGDKTFSQLISLSQQWDDELKRHAKALDDISKKGLEAWREAEADRMAEWGDALSDMAEAIADIEEEYVKDRNEIIEEGNKELEQQQDKSNDNLEEMQRRHNMDMRHEAERFRLAEYHSERRYIYERGQLLAEGDVLALEELDARYEMERQEARENFELQKRQAEELFQLQLEYQRQAAREQVAVLRAGIQEQLAELAGRRREEIDEEREAMHERAAQADFEREQRRREDRDAYLQDVADEDERHAERKERLTQQLGEIGVVLEEGTEYGMDNVKSGWHAMFGPDGELDRMLDDFEYRYYLRMSRLRAGMTGAMPAAGGGAVPAGYRTHFGGGYQYGGEAIYSKPTLIEVGHGRERVRVESLGAFGMTHRWAGSPIPVRGEGSMAGMDMAAVSQAIAAGISSSMEVMNRELRDQLGYGG